jgi:hypothetical protein
MRRLVSSIGGFYAPRKLTHSKVHARKPAIKKNISTTTTKTAPAVDSVRAELQSAKCRPVTPRFHRIVGLDVGDRQRHYCVLDLEGTVVAEGAVKTTEASLHVVIEGKGRNADCFGGGTHSPWISRLLTTLSHDVLVANPRKLLPIAENDSHSAVALTC